MAKARTTRSNDKIRSSMAGRRALMVAAGTAALALPLAKAQAQDAANSSVQSKVAACQSLIRRAKILTMVTAWPKTLAPLHRAATLLAQRVEGLSDGKLRIKLYAAGELIPAAQNYDAARDGDVD